MKTAILREKLRTLIEHLQNIPMILRENEDKNSNNYQKDGDVLTNEEVNKLIDKTIFP